MNTGSGETMTSVGYLQLLKLTDEDLYVNSCYIFIMNIALV